MGQAVSKVAKIYNDAGEASEVATDDDYDKACKGFSRVVCPDSSTQNITRAPQLIIVIDGTWSMVNHLEAIRRMLTTLQLMFELYGITRVGLAIYTDFSAEIIKNHERHSHVIHTYTGSADYICDVIRNYRVRGNGTNQEASRLMLAFLSSLSVEFPALSEIPILMIGDAQRHSIFNNIPCEFTIEHKDCRWETAILSRLASRQVEGGKFAPETVTKHYKDEQILPAIKAPGCECFPVDHLSISVLPFDVFDYMSTPLGFPSQPLAAEELIERIAAIVRFLTGYEVAGFKPAQSYLKLNFEALQDPAYDLRLLMDTILKMPIEGLTMAIPLNKWFTQELNKRGLAGRWSQIIQKLRDLKNDKINALIDEFNGAKTALTAAARASKASACSVAAGCQYFSGIPNRNAEFTELLKYYNNAPITGLQAITVKTAEKDMDNAIPVNNLALLLFALFGIDFRNGDGVSIRAAIVMYLSVKRTHAIFPYVRQMLHEYFEKNAARLLKWTNPAHDPVRPDPPTKATMEAYKKDLEIPSWYANLTVLTALASIFESLSLDKSRVVCLQQLLILKTIKDRRVDTEELLDNSYVEVSICQAAQGPIPIALCQNGECVYCDGRLTSIELAYASRDEVRKLAGQGFHDDPRSIAALRRGNAELRREFEGDRLFTRYQLVCCRECHVNYPIMDTAWKDNHKPICHECRLKSRSRAHDRNCRECALFEYYECLATGTHLVKCYYCRADHSVTQSQWTAKHEPVCPNCYTVPEAHKFNCESCGLLLLDRSEKQTHCVKCQNITGVTSNGLSICELAQRFNVSAQFGSVHNLEGLAETLNVASLQAQEQRCELPEMTAVQAQLLRDSMADQNCFIGQCTVTMCSNKCCVNPLCGMKACKQCMFGLLNVAPGHTMPNVTCPCGSLFDPSKFGTQTGALLMKGIEAAQAVDKIAARCKKCNCIAIADKPEQDCGAMEGTYNFTCGKCAQPQGTRIARPCPHCNYISVRSDDFSCIHMQCANCRTHWCWLCRAITPTSTDFYYNHMKVHAGANNEFMQLIYGYGPTETRLMVGDPSTIQKI